MLLAQRGSTVGPRVVAKRNDPHLGDSSRKQRVEPANAIISGEGSLPMSVQTMEGDDATRPNTGVSNQRLMLAPWE